MFKKEVKLLMEMKHNFAMQQFVGGYCTDEGMIITASEDGAMVSISFKCSVFNINKLKHDIELLNFSGMKIKIRA